MSIGNKRDTVGVDPERSGVIKVALMGLFLGFLGACTSEPVVAPAPESQTALSAVEVGRIHNRAIVIDAHADIEYADAPSRYAGADGVSKVAPQLLRSGAVDAVVMSIAVGPGPRDADGYAAARATADKKLSEVQALVSDPANNMILATTAAQVERAAEGGPTAVILGFQNARILGTDVSALDEFFAAGVRVFALTHMGHNDFADSSRPVYRAETSSYEVNEEHGGLSDLGRAAISRINKLGGVVDVSQLSKAATLEVLDRTTAPIIASHSNVQALSDVRRNLSDIEIDRIARNDGVIHVAAFGGYLFDSNDVEMDQAIVAARREAGLPDIYDYPYELYWELDDPDVQSKYISSIRKILGPGSVDAMLNHIDYIAKRVGVEHVGIGNDFNHGGGIAGFDNASGAPNVTRGLIERGYTAGDIEKIWGGNFLRVLRAAADQATVE